MNDNIKAGAEIHAGDGGYSIGTKEKYDEFVKNRNRGMNERIKLLWDQAKTSGVHPEFGEYDKYSAEKFAELIVRECMEQVWYTREDGINGNVSLVIKDRMKQHFGVEE